MQATIEPETGGNVGVFVGIYPHPTLTETFKCNCQHAADLRGAVRRYILARPCPSLTFLCDPGPRLFSSRLGLHSHLHNHLPEREKRNRDKGWWSWWKQMPTSTTIYVQLRKTRNMLFNKTDFSFRVAWFLSRLAIIFTMRAFNDSLVS